HVVRQPPVGEDPRVHLGVQGLHPPVEALREPGELGDFGDRYPGRGDPGRGGAGGDEGDAGGVQAAGEFFQSGLVVDADQRPPDRNCAHPSSTFRPLTSNPSRAIRPTTSTSRDRSATLMRSCRLSSSSPSRTGTACWAITGPSSTPAATRNT